MVFNEGYSASSGESLTRADLSGVAIRLGRLLMELLPEPEVIGLLALMLLQESRRAARTSSDGELVLLGRAGRLVKIGARRVDLGEIEAALRSVPGIREAYATMAGGRRQEVAAAVASELSRDDLRSALSGKLAPWKQPHRLLVLPTLPTTARGKLDRAALERLLSESADTARPTLRKPQS
jgi:predicted RNA polymerase sigma factor